jgi:flagellar basal-body rod protein FlgC
MNFISGVEVTSSALSAQKLRLDIVAQNIANAQTTRTPAGGPYQRKIVTFETELLQKSGGASLSAVRVGGITSDTTEGQKVFNPQHPDAGSDGLVQMPNVNLAFEMVDLITASRAYEANLSAMKSARTLAQQTLRIGKQ